MKFALQNVKAIKSKTDNALTKRICNYVIDYGLQRMLEKLWQFSAFIVYKGCKIIEVGTHEIFLDNNIEKSKAKL